MTPVDWYAIRTNPKCEGRAIRSLGGEGFEPYFPTAKQLVVHHRTRKLIEKERPLFVGYVFLPVEHGRLFHVGKVRGCDGVRGIMGVCGTPRRIPPGEFAQVVQEETRIRDRFEEMKRRRTSQDHTYRIGDKVHVKSGPFTGFQGEVVDARSRRAIKVLTEIFGRMTEVAVPLDYLAVAA